MHTQSVNETDAIEAYWSCLLRHLFQGNADAKIFVHIFLYSMHKQKRIGDKLESCSRVLSVLTVLTPIESDSSRLVAWR